MDLSDKIKASNFEKSEIYQAGRNITINQGLSASDVISIVKSVVESELACYSQKAECKAEERLKQFSDELVEQLADKVANRLDRFNEPSIQFAVRDAALCYVRSGKELDKNALIDLIIERVKVDEHTTKQMLIDQALKIVPTLSNECITLLALLGLKKLYYTGRIRDFNNWLSSLNHLLNNLPTFSLLDVGYLQQAGCVSGIVGLTNSFDYLDSLLENCDFVFRHPVSELASEEFKIKYGLKYDSNGSIIKDDTKSKKFYSFIIDFLGLQENDVKCITVNWSSYKNLIEILHKNSLDYLIDDINKMYESSTPFSKAEVKDYLSSINPNWSTVIELYSRKDINSYTLTVAGYYIASRVLSTAENPISIETFYSSI